MTFNPDDALKVIPGKMYEMHGSHMIKKPVPLGFDWIVSLAPDDFDSYQLKEGDCFLIMGLAPPPIWNTNLDLLQYDPMYPVLHILWNGKDYAIKQYQLTCGLYRELA